MNLRQQHGNQNSTPVTTRQLESLIRLSQARAKLELREIVTENDAKEVIEIMKESLFDVATDEFGMVDFSRSSGMSRSKLIKVFISAMNKASEVRQSALFTVTDLMQMADSLRGLREDIGNFYDFVDLLNHQNYILKKGPRLYQLQTSSFSQHSKNGFKRGR